MPMSLRAERHGGLAGQDAGTQCQVWNPRALAQAPDRVDEVECRPHRPLGVVLLRDRRAPHRHDRVADELLDRPAVATDVSRQSAK